MDEWTHADVMAYLGRGVASDLKIHKLKYPLVRPQSTPVAVSLPMVCLEASCPKPDHRDTLSVLAGAMKRIASKTPTLTHARARKIRRYAKRHIFPLFAPLELGSVKTVDAWIDQINHPEHRKEELRKAYKEFSERVQRTKDLKENLVDSFVKDEPYPTLKPCRWINASPDEIKILYGPWADAIMHELCKHPAMIKVVPVKDRAKAIFDLLYSEGSVYHTADYTSYEAHFTRVKMQISHDFFLHMTSAFGDARRAELLRFGDPGILMKVLDILMSRRLMKMRGFGTISLEARRMSGEMDTSLSNTFTNFVMANFMCHHKSGGKHRTAPCVVEGDDSLIRYPDGLEVTEQDYAEFGWVIKMEIHESLNTASFCGLVFDIEDQIVVRDPVEAIAKFGWTNRRYLDSSYACRMSLLRSKALSMCCEYSQVPVLGAFARRVLYHTKHVNIRGSIIRTMNQYEREKFLPMLSQKPWLIKFHPPPRTRVLVETLYGITVEEQQRLEARISTLPLGPFRLNMEFPVQLENNMLRCTEQKEIDFPDCIGKPLVQETIKTYLSNASGGLKHHPAWRDLLILFT